MKTEIKNTLSFMISKNKKYLAANLSGYVQDLLPEKHNMLMSELRGALRTRYTQWSADKAS